jgi:hypothetical protein
VDLEKCLLGFDGGFLHCSDVGQCCRHRFTLKWSGTIIRFNWVDQAVRRAPDNGKVVGKKPL